MEAGAAFVGVAIRQRREPITYDQFQANRMGKYRWEEIEIVLWYFFH